MPIKHVILAICLSLILWAGIITGCSATLDYLDKIADEPQLTDEEIWKAGVGQGNL